MRFGSRLAGLLAMLGTLALMPAAAAQEAGAEGGVLEAACGAGEAEACLALGHLEADGERALALYREACALESGTGCLAGGALLYGGRGVAADIPGAVDLFEQGCGLGEGEACLRLGGELEFPDFGEADSAGALEAYARACEAGRPEGCEKAGIEMPAAPVETAGAPMAPAEADKDAAVIVTAYAPPAEDETPAERGPSFAAEALPDLDFGAAMGEPEILPEDEAAEATAERAEDSPPSEEDLALAEERRTMADACGRGDLEACEIFAAWLRDGTGGEADAVRARRIFSVICTEGSVKGCYELAWMMFDAGQEPEASPLELSRARFLFSETCKAGVIEACLQAGDLRREGVGGTIDIAGAGRLYAIACEAGLEPACPLAAEGTPPAEETAAPEEADEAAAASEDDLPADEDAPAEDETISD
ncbi:sel1 repeat family protein [Hyphomonas sp. CACIAM 19H1]|uniref:sel1 repeat family protein n=1 Tax=Hyphomonas sp. CACIAM 19H1 TaxID=1873716 RepID=UPI0013B0691D|nr:sel1 repeat family protein [Hyphomonas sp. CACIAM 19H1]